MEIGFIGTGRIGRRLVGALAGAGHAISVTRRSEAVAAELAAAHAEVAVVDTPAAVAARSDVVFLCLAADVARQVLPRVDFRPGQAVISVMAGVALDELQRIVAPADDVCITIPMPFIDQGGCPLPVYPRSQALEALYGQRNPVIVVGSESALTPFWAVAGSMSSVLEELRTMAAWLGERIHDHAAGERYVAGLYGGYLATLDKDGADRLGAALADLSIEGGLNATMREWTARSGHYAGVRTRLDALHERLQE